ncbi:MAG: ABC transporter permease [Clostridia bacterium]|nr:ABC transporter permease [Clostridia bacterium]
MPFLIRQTLVYAVPLMIVALAGVYAERSGIINLALEGIMIFGAFMGVLFVHLVQQWGWFQPLYDSFSVKISRSVTEYNMSSYWGLQGFCLLAMIFAAVSGAVFSLLLAFAAINLKADQTVGGTALNLMAPALVLFFIRIIANQNTLNVTSSANFMLKKEMLGYDKNAEMGFLGASFIDKVYLATYVCIILFVVAAIILYKTRFGLRLRSCGENPQASASLGINVMGKRYAGTVISGALAGLGGFVYVLTTQSCSTNGDVAGFGFLALAVMIFGNWKPLNIAGAALLFGLFKCVAASYSTLDLNGDGVYLLKEWNINANIYRMAPYVITLIVLAFTSKSSRAPKAEGIPYDAGKR